MEREGPDLESLILHVQACPEVFLQKTTSFGGPLSPVALLADVFTKHYGYSLSEENLRSLSKTLGSIENNHTTASLVAWFFHEIPATPYAITVETWLQAVTQDWSQIFGKSDPKKFLSDRVRCEEFVRVCLARCSLRPRGETELQATDRLSSLNSLERRRLERIIREKELRAEQVRQAMAAAEAAEAAAKYMRE